MRLLICIALLGAPASDAYALEDGARCTLNTQLKARAKAKNKSKSTIVKSGTEIEIISTGRKWTAARVGGKTRYFRNKAVNNFCIADSEDDAELVAPTSSTEVPDLLPGPPSELFGDASKIKVAVLDLRGSGIDDETRNALTQTLSKALDELGPFSTISSRDIASMLELEAQKQILGCSDDSCLAEVGAALGADLLVSGSVVKLGDTVQIQVQLTNIVEAAVQARASREYSGDPSGLFDEMRTAAHILARDILAEKSGQLTVSVNEEGASVRVDGKIVGVSPLSTFDVAGGLHTLEVEKSGFVVHREDVRINQDREQKVNVSLMPSAEYIAQYKADAGFTRTMAWLSMGAGVVALGIGGAAYAVGASEADSLSADTEAFNQQSLRTTAEAQALEDREKQVAMWDTTMIIAGGVGVAALATGIVLFISGDDPARYDIDTDVDLRAARDEDRFFANIGLSGGTLGFRF